MKTLYVGGTHLFNRFSNLQAAIARADHDDVIELHKDVDDVCLIIDKNITINGNGHHITPKDNKAAFDCRSFVTFNHLWFDCKPRTNALILYKGGKLANVKTRIIGPARALYPTVVQKGGELTIEDCEIMQMEAKRVQSIGTKTILNRTHILDYYNGGAYLNNKDYTLSLFCGTTIITDSTIMCSRFEGDTVLTNTTLKNFNKAAGPVKLVSCKLDAKKVGVANIATEPLDGPLKDWNSKVVPYALHIAGGKVTAENFSSDMTRECIGFYMTSGSLDIRSTTSTNSEVRHLIKGGAVVFNDVTDDGFYEIKKAQCGVIRSTVNTSSDTKSAMERLDAMIGLDSMKKQIRTIMNTITVNMRYPKKDFGFSNHMVFAGDPGTGKTTVAKLVAEALFEIGAVPENKFMEVPASQLIKGYVGQTGEHVESIMKKALGGVLFIDEAYELAVKDGQNTFNNDALAVLLRYMEDYRDRLVVIAAGYEKEMREFLASNPGLTRRFQWVSFMDYSPNEMADMFESMAAKYDESFAFKDANVLLTDCFAELTSFYLNHPDSKGHITNGGNGGLVRNLFQQVVFTRNNRIVEDPASTVRIIRSDIETGLKEEMKKAMNVTFGTGKM